MKHILIIALFTQLLLAAPAFQGKRTFTQPDGSLISYKNQGDEHLHWSESEDGEVIMYNKTTKQFEYAEIKDETLKPSGTRYKKVDPSSKHSRSNKASQHLYKDQLRDLYKLKRDKRLKRVHPNK